MSTVKQRKTGKFPLLHGIGFTLSCIIDIIMVFIIVSLIGLCYLFDRIIEKFQRKG